MAFRKVLAVLALLGIVSLGAANLVYVNITDDTGLSVPYHAMTVEENRFILNTSVENIGSVGCTFRVHGTFEQNETTYEAFSEPADLFPGGVETVKLQYYPVNYTGTVRANFSIRYCGETQHLNTTTFQADTEPVPASTIQTKTIEAADDHAVIEIEQDGLLLPIKKPGQWAVSHARARGGHATIEYDAPLFNPGKTITFAVFNTTSNSVVGQTDVALEDQRTRLERFMADRTNIMLLLSVLTNLALLLLLGKQWREGKF